MCASRGPELPGRCAQLAQHLAHLCICHLHVAMCSFPSLPLVVPGATAHPDILAILTLVLSELSLLKLLGLQLSACSESFPS